MCIEILKNDSIISELAPNQVLTFARANERTIYYYFLYRKIAGLPPICLDALEGDKVMQVLDDIYQEILTNTNRTGQFAFPKQISATISSIKRVFTKGFPEELAEKCYIQSTKKKNRINFYEVLLEAEDIIYKENSSFKYFMKS